MEITISILVSLVVLEGMCLLFKEDYKFDMEYYKSKSEDYWQQTCDLDTKLFNFRKLVEDTHNERFEKVSTPEYRLVKIKKNNR
jgi:hypothetical protein